MSLFIVMKTSCKYIFIAGTLLIWLIKFLIRPYVHATEPLRFILGIAPNLIGSFLIPFAAVWFFNGRTNMAARFFNLSSAEDLRFVCMASFDLLLINECLQLIPIFGRTFDLNDILFSAIGLLISYLFFENSYRFSSVAAQTRGAYGQ